MEGLISTFHIDAKLLIAQVINFGIVFAVLYFFALKPISKLMAERSEKIALGLKNADENEIKLKQTQDEYDAALRKAKIEAQDIFAKARIEAETKRQEMIKVAEIDVTKLIESGKVELVRQRDQMLSEAKTEIVSMVSEALKKTLGAEISVAIDRKVIEKDIQELSKKDKKTV